MKRRIFSVITALALCLGLLPGIAGAEDTSDLGPEVEYSLDGGTTWVDCEQLVDIYWQSGYNTAPNPKVRLKRDITYDEYGAVTLCFEGKNVEVDGNGHTIKRDSACKTQIFSLDQNNSSLTLKNIIIDGGAVWSGEDPAIRINTGLSCEGNHHLIIINGGGTLILDQGAVLQNNDLKADGTYGGAVFVWSGTLVMRDGSEIRNNAAKSSGAGVYIYDRSKLQMEGGEISGNYAGNNGGGVCINTGGTFEMTGGSVTRNAALAGGGGISAFTGDAKLTGGQVSGNAIDRTMGGGVLVHNGSLTVGGDLVVRDNLAADDAANNIYLNNGKKIAVEGTLGQSAQIGVTVPAGSAPTEGNSTEITSNSAESQRFFSDDTRYVVSNSGSGTVQLTLREPSTVTFDAGEGIDAPAPRPTNEYGKLGELPELTREGYTLDGWFTEKNGGTKITTDTVFDSNATIYAHWLINRTVTFVSDGEETGTQTVADGRIVEKPAAPTKDGYTFGGWYKDAACTSAWDFDTDTVTGDINLYAKWTPNVPSHTHSYSSAWSSDSSSHWHACSCGEKSDIAAHIPGEWIIDQEATSTTEGSRHKACTVCGYTTETESIPATGGITPGPSTPSTPSVPSTPSTPSLPVSTDKTTEGGVSTTETTAKPSATTKGETATTEVSTSVGNEIVKQAEENKSENVVIAPEVKGDVTRTEVSIPAKTVEEIGSKTEASLTISTPVADVTIPNGGLADLASEGGTVSVTAEVKGNTVELSLTAGGKSVESVPGGVTVTVPLEETKPGTVAVLVKEDGTRQVIRKSTADGNSVTIPLDGSAKIEIVDNGKTFSDVPADNWASGAVAFASSHELFNGTSDTTFSPDLPMSRGMLAVVLHNLEGNPDAALNSTFTDVSDSMWYAEGVAWAAGKGIITGYGNGMFGPNDNITREQLAVMLWRYAGSPAATEKELHFTDADKASGYALEALRWAVENGVMGGYGNGRLAPQGLATRAQAAQMLMNFLKNK